MRRRDGLRDRPDRDEFWERLSEVVGDHRPLDIRQSEIEMERHFGDRLRDLIVQTGVSSGSLGIQIRAMEYGSIELFLALIGGDELLSDMFWGTLEFYAPQAFNETLHINAPMFAEVANRRTLSEEGTQGSESVQTLEPVKKLEDLIARMELAIERRNEGKPDRISAASRAPLVAWALLIVVMIGWAVSRLDAVEKERSELQHDYTALITKIMEQNAALTAKTSSKSENAAAQPEEPGSRRQTTVASPTAPTPASAPAVTIDAQSQQQKQAKPEDPAKDRKD
jgi:hypothetical protein